MAYWWAGQNTNHKIAIENGTLWSCPMANGSEPINRKLLTEMQVGDIVFHNHHGNLKVISKVTESWVKALRPEGYPKLNDAESDEGWLVRVQPIVTDL